MDKCLQCRHTELLKGTRKVSLSSMIRSFNEMVCNDHFFYKDFACSMKWTLSIDTLRALLCLMSRLHLQSCNLSPFG